MNKLKALKTKLVVLLYYTTAFWLFGNDRLSISSKLRVFYLTLISKKIGKRVAILKFVEVFNAQNFSLGDDSGLGMNCKINCEASNSIGNRVLIGPEVMIFTSNHIWSPNSRTYFEQGLERQPVKVEDDVWLGARCIILPGVTIGRGATVAAGAIVSKDVKPYAVVAGIPARQIKIKKVNE